jgi:SAM-dependent methyltransferase
MTTEPASALAERLTALFQHLGIERAHIAARDAADWQGFATAHPDRIASLNLVCPVALDMRPFAALASRTLVISGDRGVAAERVAAALQNVEGIASVRLAEYEALMWSDLAAEHGTEIALAMLSFMRSVERQHAPEPMRVPESEGEMAGISYRIRGAGPPLVLMPLLLAPSQWTPLLSALGEHYCTVQLGGAFLGTVAILEARGRSVYLGMIRTVLDLARVHPGETVLDVGCGSGVAIREVAQRSGRANRLIGVDMSPYLLREAKQLARQQGFGDMIEFREGRAEALPLPDDSIDVTLACTVLEEGDADRMLKELVRVTKPGGRVAVIVRAVDIPAWVNVPLSQVLRAKVSVPGLFGAGVASGGCADATLYERLSAAGLAQLRCFPQFEAVMPEQPRLRMLQQQALATLDSEQAIEWRRAIAQAETEGTSFIAMPHHCAVATKP